MIDLSIIIPMYNNEDIILNRLSGLMNVDDCDINYEVIVVDDGSTDRSIEVVKEIEWDKLRLIENPINQGTAAARNIGVELSRGKWIQFFDSDDYVIDNYFEQISKHLNSDVDVLVYGITSKWFDKRVGRTITTSRDKRVIAMYNIVCNKLYKRDVIIPFKPVFQFEDVVFLFDILANKDLKYKVIDNLYYHINRTNTNSKMANVNSSEFLKMAKYCIRKARLSRDPLVSKLALEIFVGTLFTPIYKRRHRMLVCAYTVLINARYLPNVASDGIRQWTKDETKLLSN